MEYAGGRKNTNQRPPHGPRTHTTTHEAMTPKTPVRTPSPTTGKHHYITPHRDHTYTRALVHLLYLFHRLTPLRIAAVSTA